MKKLISLCIVFLVMLSSFAQESPKGRQIPITITLFSESVGVPNFKNFFKDPSFGIRVGTEFYYANKPGHQTLQTVNLGYYYHKDFQSVVYISSEFGYRKFIGNVFLDGTIGGGYLLVTSAQPRYESRVTDFEKISNTFGRFMPTLGLGAGYRFNAVTFFSRYEMFGEVPFGFKGLPALPHKTLHFGTRFNLK
ncbi:MAG: hypothetical protein JNK44_04780 [Cyclobacteriaceae bacterium]|nr:hypothetical protein [Cyclobacteriaceae bacterium]